MEQVSDETLTLILKELEQQKKQYGQVVMRLAQTYQMQLMMRETSTTPGESSRLSRRNLIDTTRQKTSQTLQRLNTFLKDAATAKSPEEIMLAAKHHGFEKEYAQAADSLDDYQNHNHKSAEDEKRAQEREEGSLNNTPNNPSGQENTRKTASEEAQKHAQAANRLDNQADLDELRSQGAYDQAVWEERQAKIYEQEGTNTESAKLIAHAQSTMRHDVTERSQLSKGSSKQGSRTTHGPQGRRNPRTYTRGR